MECKKTLIGGKEMAVCDANNSEEGWELARDTDWDKGYINDLDCYTASLDAGFAIGIGVEVGLCESERWPTVVADIRVGMGLGAAVKGHKYEISINDQKSWWEAQQEIGVFRMRQGKETSVFDYVVPVVSWSFDDRGTVERWFSNADTTTHSVEEDSVGLGLLMFLDKSGEYSNGRIVRSHANLPMFFASAIDFPTEAKAAAKEQTGSEFPTPEWAASSKRYMELFNEVAKEKKLSITYTGDSACKGKTNVPDVGEITIDDAMWKRYGPDEKPQFFNKRLKNAIAVVQKEIEHRILRMNREGVKLFPVKTSGTYERNLLQRSNPAERAWVERVKRILFEASMNIYGVQTLPDYAKTYEAVKGYNNPDLTYNMFKSRSSSVETGPVTDFANAEKYATAIPWMPQLPSYNMMWPMDFSKDELKFVNDNYTEFDPIRLPYTFVSRIEKSEADSIENNPKRIEGRQVEWARRGPGDRYYRVLNMVVHPEIKHYFESMASVLEENADVEVEGVKLDPEFRDYTLTVARCLRNGDFETLLKADMEQSKGNIYFTLFPHEGYWEDGIKFPLDMVIGYRDPAVGQVLNEQGYALNWLGEKVADVAHKSNFGSYIAKKIDVENMGKTAVFPWPLAIGGFNRAFGRDVGGQDYPKRPYRDSEGRPITGHRVVMYLDALESWVPLIKSAADTLFEGGVEGDISADGLIYFATGHEASHGTQISPTDNTLAGTSFSDALGYHWGVLVEPWADAGAFLFNRKLYEDGKSSEDEYKKRVITGLMYNFVRFRPRKAALSEAMVREGPHITGSNILIGWLFEKGALVFNSESGKFRIDDAKLVSAFNGLHDTLADFAVRGELGSYKKFMKKYVEILPENIEGAILAAKKSFPSYVILNHGEFDQFKDFLAEIK